MQRYRKPYRIKKKRYFWQSRFFWLGIFFAVIFGGIFYLIFFSSLFQIKNIEISGNQKVEKENLESLANEKINQKILFFLSRSIFLTNFNEIKKEILGKFPQIEEINLKRKLPDRILIQIKERKPVAIFCLLHQPNLTNGQDRNCFFIDKAGIVFEFAEMRQKDLPVLQKEVSWKINLGEKIIKEEEFSKILEVEAKLKKELKILSEEILVVSEDRFNVKTSENWQIYFNLKEDLNWQLTKVRAVLEKEIPAEKRKNLEYIDVRFGNFAPYKYKD